MDPILNFVNTLRAAPADDSAVRPSAFPVQRTVGAAPQRAPIARMTYSGPLGALMNAGNTVSNFVDSRKQTGPTPGDILALAALASGPVIGGAARLLPEVTPEIL